MSNDFQLSGEHVLLFLRSGTDPYLYAGRLGYVSHHHNNLRQPVTFTWLLRDIDRLRTEPAYNSFFNLDDDDGNATVGQTSG